MSGLILPYKGVTPNIADDAFIAPNATVIGNVEIGAESSLWFNTVVRGDVGKIFIGARSNLQDGTIVHISQGLSDVWIGSDVLIGHGAIIHGATLEDGCFVGMGATVLDKVVVESGGMIAAGALVTPGKRIKKGELWGGGPAKLMRQLSAEEMAEFSIATEGYRALGQEYRGALGA